MSRHYPAPFTSSNSVGSGLNRVAYIQRESHFSVQDFTIRDLVILFFFNILVSKRGIN